MKYKLNTVIIFLMMYVNFMGPFVLRQTSADHWPQSKRKLAITWSDVYGFLGILCMVVVALLCWGVFALLTIPALPVLALLGAIVLLVIAGAVLLVGAKCLVKSINLIHEERYQRRALMQQTINVLTPENLQRIKEKTREFIAKAKIETRYEHRIAEAETSTVRKWLKRKMRQAGIIRMPVVMKPMKPDKISAYMRQLYKQEFKDLQEMNKNIEKMMKEKEEVARKNKSQIDLKDMHFLTSKIRRHFYKIRMQRAIDLLQTHIHAAKKYQSTWEYRFKKHEKEIEEMDAAIKDENVPKAERDEIQRRLDSLLKGDNEGELTEEGRRAQSWEIERMYRYAGMSHKMFKTRFFMWYIRAKSALLLMDERVRMTRIKTEAPLSAEQEENVQRAIVKIDEAIHNISEGLDLN